jgi:hypothetical protein
LFFGRHASIDIIFHRLRCESNTKMIGGGLHSSAENVSSLALALPLDICLYHKSDLKGISIATLV